MTPCPENRTGCAGPCVGHCPRCDSNQIGGGGANGMFCATCSHCWGDDESCESFLDYFVKKVDAEESGTI